MSSPLPPSLAGSPPQQQQLRVLYYLAAYGAPHSDEKLTILLNNLRQLVRQRPVVHRLDVVLNAYGRNFGGRSLRTVAELVRKVLPAQSRVLTHRLDKGVLVELWKTNPHHTHLVNRYDRVLFILDDVQILRFDVQQVERVFLGLSLDIFTPLVYNATIRESNRHMYEIEPGVPEPQVKLLNMAEMFCYYLRPATFLELVQDRYSLTCPCMWGADLSSGPARTA